jgi:hypothetical protein
MNALFSRGVKVWNCGAEGWQCPDPLIIKNLPMAPVSGDFVFFDSEKYLIGEVKISKETCRWISAKKSYQVGRDTPLIAKGQICFMRKGGGILIIVAEIPPSVIHIVRPKGSTKEKCQKLLLEEYHNRIGKGEIPYEVYLLNEKRFEVYYQGFLEASAWRTKTWRKIQRFYKRLNLTQLNKLVPESKVCLTIKDFFNGRIADEIKLLLEGE